MQPKKLGINFFGPIGSSDGIGKFSNKILNLLKLNFNVKTFSLDRPFSLNKINTKKYEITKQLLKNSNHRINFFSFSSRWVPYYFRNISIKDLSLLIAKISGFKGEVIFDNTKLDGTPRKLLNVDILTQLGWTPSISISDGIKQALKDFDHS